MRTRIQLVFVGLVAALGGIILRLAYWQLIRGPELAVQARDQYTSKEILYPQRGEIITADGHPLVVNKPIYSLTAYAPHLKNKPSEIVASVLPLLEITVDDPVIATDSVKLEAKKTELRTQLESSMLGKLTGDGYSVLARNLTVTEKNAVSQLGMPGINFEENFTRGYPEASMSAHVVGFVGRDDLGSPTGYFGLEGFYDRELAGRAGFQKQEKDAVGNPLLIGDYRELGRRDGRTLRLHLERATQFLVEQELQKGLESYGAIAGEVLVMDPRTGGIIAMASLPAYDPAKFWIYDTLLYKNPAVANAYEPGSTFKVLVMAAALNEGQVKLDDRCDICNGPLPLDKYVIKTWNGEYHPDSTPEEIIANSDNIGMVWAQQRLGGDKLLEYLRAFGLGEKSGIDMQEEITPSFRSKWGLIDYATASFGQGIAVTSIQMLRAVGAIANEGKLMEPHLVRTVEDSEITEIKPHFVRQVITPETAKQMTDIMITAAEHGDAKWTRLPDYQVAGKTGTAQIPVAGHYDTEKTIASFVGFAPAKNPRFVMLVKLREPTSSPWGSETAAPLWFTIARRLLLHYNVPPDNP